MCLTMNRASPRSVTRGHHSTLGFNGIFIRICGYVYRYRLKKPATAISQKIGVSENGGLTPKLESPEKDEDDKPLDLGVSYFRTGRHINWVQIWQGITVINSILKSWNLELVNPRKYHLVMTNIAVGNDGPNRNRLFTY